MVATASEAGSGSVHRECCVAIASAASAGDSRGIPWGELEMGGEVKKEEDEDVNEEGLHTMTGRYFKSAEAFWYASLEKVEGKRRSVVSARVTGCNTQPLPSGMLVV